VTRGRHPFDTSVYISALRQGDETVLSLRRAARARDNKTRPLWLSAVVLHELYIGAEGVRARRELQRLEREFVKLDRLLIPSRADWTTAGLVLSKIGRKFGFELVGRARMTNDALIAMSCASRGLIVQTKNPGDFKLIAEFRSLEWEGV
jgi:predicted nucleic acid-binding protein